jgi:ABC-type microcin C transport system permease subunit YejB
MLIFIARRIAFAIPTLLIVITLSFFLMRLAPGSPFQTRPFTHSLFVRLPGEGRGPDYACFQ